MAKPKFTNSEAIEQAKLLKPNTHKIMVHCLEYCSAGGTHWQPLIRPCSSELPYPNYFVCIGMEGWRDPKDAATNMMAYKARHPDCSFRISRYPMRQDMADDVIANSVWEKREATRLADGTYEPLPWASEPWFVARHNSLRHFAHVSQDRDGMIAFTENNDKGSRDIQKRMAPGRYLDSYFSSQLNSMQNFETGAINVHGHKVTEAPIQHYANLFTRKYGDTCVLTFAVTSDEMVKVYQKGPDSCMTFRDRGYSGHIHPCSVYAAGDLQLAYLKQNDGDITARALVWPEKKKVGRLYGDSGTLLYKLLELGYDNPRGSYDAIEGARMLKVPNEEGPGNIMPFLDACGGNYWDNGTYWVMGSKPSGSGAYQNRAGNQNGLDCDSDNENNAECDNCGDNYNLDDGHYVHHVNSRGRSSEQSWCQHCGEEHTFYCVSSDQTYSDATPHIELANGGYVASVNIDGDYFQCAFNSDWYHIDDLAGVDSDGDSVSNDAVDSLNLVCVEDVYYRPEDAPDTSPEVANAPEVPRVTAVDLYHVEKHLDWLYPFTIRDNDGFIHGGYGEEGEAHSACLAMNLKALDAPEASNVSVAA
jgi:hypothetical protein